jgi:hypothetical protein
MPLAIGGTACGLVLAMVLIVAYFYNERPKKWDARALHTVRAVAGPLNRLDDAEYFAERGRLLGRGCGRLGCQPAR